MKNILVIGGTGYVGKAIVKELNDTDNINCLYTFCSQESDDPNALSCDITNSKSVEQFQEKLSTKVEKLDGIIISCGIDIKEIFNSPDQKINFPKISKIPSDSWRKTIDFYSIHLGGIIKTVLPLLQKSKQANIIILGSLVGIKSVNSPVHLATAKSSVRGLVDSLSQELGDDNILVNSIDPGMLEGGQSNFFSNELKNDYLTHCALKRFGKASEVAQLATWLVCKNSFITAKSILLDGGL